MKIRERSENFHFQGGGVARLGGAQKIFIFKGVSLLGGEVVNFLGS